MSEKNKISREELFETVPVWRAIFTLTIPIILSSIAAMLYNLCDTYFVGMLNDPVQNAAVTLAAPAMTLFYGVTNLFGTGSSSLMSRSLGVKDTDKVKKAAATGLYFGLFFAILLSVITLVFNEQTLNILGTDQTTYTATKNYMFWTVCMGAVPGIMSILFGFALRAEGQSMHAGIGVMSGCFLNILLDPFFILPWGLNMGAAGAGLATFISNCFACGYFLVLLCVKRGKTLVSVNPGDICFHGPVLSEIFLVGFPGVIQNILNVASMTILNNLVAAYGANAVAAAGIANKVNQLPIQIIFGFTQGVMPLIGYNYASLNYPRMRETIRKTATLALAALCLIMVLFNTAGAPIIRVFMDNDEIVSVGAKFLSGFGISLPLLCVDFLVVGISQAFGIGRDALIFSILRKLVFEIPFIYLYDHFIGLYGIAYAQCSAEACMTVIAVIVFFRLMKKAQARTK